MSLTRPWKAPPADGFTVHVVTDTHIEHAAQHTNRVEALRGDLANLHAGITHNQLTVHVGDLFHNLYDPNSYTLQRPLGAQLLSDLTAADGAPVLYAVGNHELWGQPNSDLTAQYYGFPGRNYTQIHGPLKFIVYAALNETESGVHAGTPADSWVVPDDVLDWIEDEIDSTPDGLRAVLVSHCPPGEQFEYSKGYTLEPLSRISQILADHPLLVAWFTGHRHRWFDDSRTFMRVDYPDHSVALIEGGCCGGTLPTTQAEHPVESARVNASTYATYFPPGSAGGHRWECRVRDHDTRTWGTIRPGYSQYLEVLALPEPQGSFSMAATSGMSFAGGTREVLGEFTWSATSSYLQVLDRSTMIRSFGLIVGEE